MQKKILVFYIFCVFLSLVFLVFLTQIGLTADKLNLKNNIINFYDLQASFNESHEKTISALIPLYNDKTEQIALYLKDDFITKDKSKQLSGRRLKVVSSQKELSLNKEEQQLNIKTDKIIFEGHPVVLLELNIEVEPDDLPGKYFSKLIISQPGPEGTKLTTEVIVQFKVLPWLHLELESDIHKILTSDFKSNNLHSTVPGQIIISGNTPWKLWVRGDSTDGSNITRNSEIILNIYSEDERLVINKEKVTIGKREIMLAESVFAIVDPKKRCELTFDMQINDFINMKAGKITFPVHFRLEQIKGEEL